MSTPIRLLIADDHPVVRDGIRAVLGTQPDLVVVAEASTGAEAVELARTHRPDVILMDLQMPQMDGTTAIAQIRAHDPAAKVLVLTTYDTDGDITKAVQAGATGYLLKDTHRDQLFDAIRSAARGQTVLSPAVATRLLARMRTSTAETLSSREIDVLTAVARGLTNKGIARQLHISEATVKTHLLHVCNKLDVDNRTAAVTAAIEQGIIRLDR
ncbi:MAG: response regulator [Propionibacteriales bacterium]|nr:response regulator [Propionibacteriales bacterium]